MGLCPLPHPKPYWVLVSPACRAYAWLLAWCLLFIRLFLLNFCFCLAHLAPVVPVFHLSELCLYANDVLHTLLPSLYPFPPGAQLLFTLGPLAGALDLGCRRSEGLQAV